MSTSKPPFVAYSELVACPGLHEVFRLVDRAAQSDASVLIVGESGVGKELVARALHELSPRANEPFVSLNLSAIPVELAETALFGHVKGAFTGAQANSRGFCCAADRGTLFLDEITEAPLALQAKLLRFLQSGEIQAVGCDRIERIDVRVLAATNRPPTVAIRSGHLREDLFYRLNIVQIPVPPLRERPDDIDVLTNRFLAEFNDKYQRSCHIAPEARSLLRQLEWRGNVRQLRGAIERLVVLCEGEHIDFDDLPDELLASIISRDQAAMPALEGALTLEQHVQRLILDILAETGGNVTEAARRLGIGRSTLYRKLKRLPESATTGVP
jgi:transcriptional regulator with PAS, ATPase and Fis domain